MSVTVDAGTEAVPQSPRFPYWAEWLLVSLLFLGLTLVYTNPLWRHPATYLTDAGDPIQHLSVSWWTSQKLLSGHWAGMWDLPPMFYPAHNTLAYGDPQFGTTLLGLPLFAATGNIVLAYNFVVLIAMPLSALGTYALVRLLSRSRTTGLLAAIVWGFGIWHSGEAAHQQVLSLEGLPFVLLALHRYGETRRARYLVGLFLAWLAQEFFAEYWGAFLGLLIAPFAFLLLRGTYRLPWRDVGRAFAVIGLAMLPWLIAQRPLLANTAQGGGHHSIHEIISHSADLADYLPPRGTMLWGPIGTLHYAPDGKSPSGEAMVSPGLILFTLACVGMALMVRPERRDAPPAEATGAWRLAARFGPYGLIVALLPWGWITALGADMLPLPGSEDRGISRETFVNLFWLSLFLWYNAPIRTWLRRHRVRFRDARSPLLPYAGLALLAMIWSCGYVVTLFGYRIMPGIHGFLTLLPGTKGFRVLLRMGAIANLALTVVGACTLAQFWRQSPRLRRLLLWQRGLAMAVLCVLAWMENVPRAGTNFGHSGPKLPPPRAVDRWLAQQPAGPLIELPLTVFAYPEGERLWYQITHRHPMVNGAETFFRRDYYPDVHTFETPQSPAALARLQELSIRYVVLDRHNPFVGQQTFLGKIPAMPDVLPPPLTLRYTDAATKVYELMLPARENPDL